MNTPFQKVSICILCFNSEETILRAVTSALSQTYWNKEIIIVDDGSTDTSVKKIKAFKKKYQLTLVEHKKNKGQGSARNSALNAATGQFVVFFDDDDISEPHRVSHQIETLLRFEKNLNSSKVACYASGIRKYPNGYEVLAQAIGSTESAPPNGPQVAKYLLINQRKPNWFYGSGTPTSALMIRTKLARDVGGFDENFGRVEDIDLAIRLALNGCYFVGSPETLFERNMTDGSHKSPEKNLDGELRLAKKYKALLDKENLFYHASNWPKLRYWHFRKQYFRFTFQLVRLIINNPIMTICHLFSTGPKRIVHEKNMSKQCSK